MTLKHKKKKGSLPELSTDLLDQYDQLAQKIADKFLAMWEYPDWWWVGNEVGGMLYVNDYFFSYPDIVDYLRYGYTIDEIIERYEESVDAYERNETIANIKNWKYEINMGRLS